MSRRLQWQLDWKSLLVTVVMLPILVSLGFWQLDRADQKRELLRQFDERQQLAPEQVVSLNSYDNYRPVIATGQFDPQRYMLLDNRIHQGRFGYQLVGLLQLQNGQWLLVDRGWLPGDPSRRTLPKPVFPTEQISLRGQLYLGEEKPFSLGEVDAKDWPRLRQWLDVSALQQDVDGLLPTVLQLNENSPAALEVSRLVVNVSPDKHTGYAVQWFAMAFVLSIIFICRNSTILELRRRKATTENSGDE